MKSRIVLGLIVIIAAAATEGVVAYVDSVSARSEQQTSGDGVTPHGKVLYWTDPMVPGSHFDHPGKSPFMDMQLVPVYESDPRIVTLTVDEQRILDVQTMAAEPQQLVRTVETEGAVTYDERNVRDVTVRVNAKVRNYHPFHVGLMVKKGQPLYELESPEIYTYIDQFLQLQKKAAAINAVSTDQSHVVKQSETTLLWRGIPKEAIDEAINKGKATDRITVKSPIDGMVVERLAVQNSLVNAGVKTGQFTTYGTPVARIADISFVYVEAKLYGDDLSAVKEGMSCDLRPEGEPGIEYSAKVSYVYPLLQDKVRYGIARIAVDNPEMALKPGMFANVAIHVPQSNAPQSMPVIPRNAVIEDGARKYVFVEVDPGHYERREVDIGEGVGKWVPIRSGIQPGERIVVSGAAFFLQAAVSLKETSAPEREPADR